MNICKCGCGKEIPYLPHHKQRPPSYLKGHYGRVNLRGNQTEWAKRRIPKGGTYCDCGCGTFIPEFQPCGRRRYSDSLDGKFYVSGHNPLPTGTKHHNWKGGRYITASGYVMVYNPEYHRANKDGHVLEHILVWEEAHGTIPPNYHVHHINGNRSDNRLENLIALHKTEHAKLHTVNGIPHTLEQSRIAGIKGAKARWG